MKAIILCAGYATRLYPLTLDKPKPLLCVAGKPLLEHILFRIEEVEDIDEIFIITNDKFYNHFLEWAKGFKTNKTLKVINDNTTSNEDRLGAIGDIHFVIKEENLDDDIIVIAGDNLFEFSLDHLNKFFREKKSSVVALYDVQDKELAKKYGIVGLDDGLKIVDFEEKPADPKSTLASTACYVFSKADIEELENCIRENKKPDNLGDFIQYISSKKEVFGFVFGERWFDIGSHEQLKEANEKWQG